MILKGRRVYPNKDGHIILFEGGYGYDKDRKVWLVRPPGGRLGSLEKHTVVEHDDGTITVSPSILITYPIFDEKDEVWHGYLEKGIWRSV